MKRMEVVDREIKLQMWDIAGGERIYSLVPAYLRGSHAVVVVYDVTSRFD